jgi:chaperonin GroES
MNRAERRSTDKQPETQRFLAAYNWAATAAGDLRGLAWASMIYGCQDKEKPPQPVPPDWDRIVEKAPEGYWEARGGVPEIIEIDGARYFPAVPAGCGYEEVRYLCVGVEAPRGRADTRVRASYPCNDHFVPTPFVAGRCPQCGLPMQHIDWYRDREWWPPTNLPKGAPHFRLPLLKEAKESARQGYGGAVFVPGNRERSDMHPDEEMDGMTMVAEQPIRPLGDRVLVRPDEQPKEHMGIILPENITEKPKTGVVLAVGAGNVATDTGERTAPDVRPGDHIVFSQYGGVDVTLGETHYLILREGDILGVITEGS